MDQRIDRMFNDFILKVDGEISRRSVYYQDSIAEFRKVNENAAHMY
jgi:hypothetical protein